MLITRSAAVELEGFGPLACSGEGAVNGTAKTMGWLSNLARSFQSGFVRNYALFMVVGFIGLLIISL